MSVFDIIIAQTQSAGLQQIRKSVPLLGSSASSSGAKIGSDVRPITHKLTYTPDARYQVRIIQAPRKDGRPGRRVVGTLPENLSITTTSDWNTPFAEGFIGSGSKLGALAQVLGWSPTVQSMTAHFWAGSSPIELSIPLVLTAHEGPNDILKNILALKSMCTPTKDKDTLFLRAPGPLLEFNYENIPPLLNDVATAGAAVGRLGMDILAAGYKIATGSEDAKKASESMKSSYDRVQSEFRKGVSSIEKNQIFSVSGTISVRLGQFFFLDDVVLRSVDENIDTVLGPDGQPLKTTVTLNFVTRLTPTFEDMLNMYPNGEEVLKLSELHPSVSFKQI